MRAAAWVVFAAVGAVVVPALAGGADEDKPKKAKVKLAVLVVFDQFRGDYLDRWGAHFGEGGFKRLTTDGAHFPDCHYPYANTSTGPGHASILAGCSADKHGIVNNSWYDRAAAEEAYCAGTPRYEHVPALPPEKEIAALDPKKKTKPVGVGTPDRMLGPTLADVLKATTGGKGKVFGLSLKDRAAVLPAGRKPDGVYWFEGRFGTSTAYRDSLPEWVSAFNKGGTAESFFGKDWTRFRDDLDYAQIVGKDDGPGEGLGVGPKLKDGQKPTDLAKYQGRTFPHPTTGGLDKVGKAYYEAMVNTPYGNDLLLAFTKACVTAEKLGQDDVPDLLAVSFSSNDLVGHAWGPDSHEVLDITLRSDALMADLLKFLDKEVGPGNYSLVVTADHGICPIPEAASAAGNAEAKRVAPTPLLVGAEKALQDAHGPVTAPAVVKPEPKQGEPAPKAEDKKERNLWIEAVSAPNLYLNHKQVKAANLTPDAVAATLAGHLKKQPGVLRAYTRAELLAAAPPSADPYWAPSKRSFHPDRSGDVVVVTAPFVLLDSYTTGTNHGTPHSYDTHAVFLAFGPTIAGGRRSEKITPLHASAILADALGVNTPANAEYGLPLTLAEAPPAPPAR